MNPNPTAVAPSSTRKHKRRPQQHRKARKATSRNHNVSIHLHSRNPTNRPDRVAEGLMVGAMPKSETRYNGKSSKPTPWSPPTHTDTERVTVAYKFVFTVTQSFERATERDESWDGPFEHQRRDVNRYSTKATPWPPHHTPMPRGHGCAWSGGEVPRRCPPDVGTSTPPPLKRLRKHCRSDTGKHKKKIQERGHI